MRIAMFRRSYTVFFFGSFLTTSRPYLNSSRCSPIEKIEVSIENVSYKNIMSREIMSCSAMNGDSDVLSGVGLRVIRSVFWL